ncbi:MAG: hypothetical protein D6768_04375 [Chloroflexi bacterium]|nr:MAG: hypothetical protein D6768_04375 [Chloroflexota bacterium]
MSNRIIPKFDIKIGRHNLTASTLQNNIKIIGQMRSFGCILFVIFEAIGYPVLAICLGGLFAGSGIAGLLAHPKIIWRQSNSV